MKNKGITLVALVVTIIIMLILAGVTLRLTLGDNGLIALAKRTRDEYIKSSYKETVDTLKAGVDLKDTLENLSDEEYMTELEKSINDEIENGNLKGATVTKDEENKSFRLETKEGYIYEITKDGVDYLGQLGVEDKDLPEVNDENLKIKLNPSGWTKGPVKVTIETEGMEVPKGYEIEYSIGGVSWSKYNKEITIEDNGTVVYARIVNKLGDYKGSSTTEIGNIDKENPKSAKITIDKNAITVAETTKATIEQIDELSGINYEKSKWVITESPNNIGTENIGAYNGGNFKNGEQKLKQINVSIKNIGDYYLHVLSVDEAENMTESISDKIVVTNVPLTAGDIAKDPSKFGMKVNYKGGTSGEKYGWDIFYADSQNIYLRADAYIRLEDAPKGKKGTPLVNKNNGSYVSESLSMVNVINNYEGTEDITDERVKKLMSQFTYQNNNYNMKAVAYMLDTSVWNPFYAGDKAEYAIGGATIELFFKSYNAKYKANLLTKIDDAHSGYLMSKDGGKEWLNYWTAYGPKVFDVDDKMYKALYGHEWIASPFATNNNNILVLFGNWIQSVSYNDTTFVSGFRPIVCLKNTSKLVLQKNNTFNVE